MPYEVSFKKKVSVTDSDEYINDCCWGGDVVRDELLPEIEGRYEDVQTEQEDWGWFIWFRKGRSSWPSTSFVTIHRMGVSGFV